MLWLVWPSAQNQNGDAEAKPVRGAIVIIAAIQRPTHPHHESKAKEGKHP